MSSDATPQGQSTPAWKKSYPVDIDWEAPIPEKNMIELFDEAVKKYGKRTCLNFMGKKLTYKEVGDMVDRFAKGLQDQGVTPGTRIGLCLPNTPFYTIAYYGALKAGATVVNFNPTYAKHEMEHQINDSGVEIMVSTTLKESKGKQLYPTVEALRGNTSLKKIITCELSDMLPTVKGYAFSLINTVKGWFGKSAVVNVKEDAAHIPFAKLMKSKGKPAPVALNPDSVAVLQYTGGTTGVPKAATLTHGNLTANIEQAKLWFTGGKETPTPEKMLVVLPFFHVFSMTVQMNLSLNIGAEIVMLPSFELKQTLDTIQKEKPTIFAGVPTLYKAILDSKTTSKYDLSSLKLCLSGGAALPQPTMEGWKKLTGLDLVEGYGLSETSPIVVANPINGQKKINSIGMPLPGTHVKITSIDLPDETVPVKVEGEICLKGPQVMKEYWGRPDETAKVMTDDGYFRTGDIGMIDEDGYVFITDRLKDMVIVNGLKAFPRKIEDAILKHPDVSEVIVIGVPDESKGEAVKAFIVMKEGKSVKPDELIKFLGDHLAHYELPRSRNVEFRDNLPKTMIGKPDKKAVKEEEKSKRAAAAKPPTP